MHAQIILTTLLLIASGIPLQAGEPPASCVPSTDPSRVRKEAKQLRDEAVELRRIAEKLDRELEAVEDKALQLRVHAANVEDGERGRERTPAEGDSEGAGAPDEHHDVLVRARATADELTLKARDLSQRIRQMQEVADRKDERADRLEDSGGGIQQPQD